MAATTTARHRFAALWLPMLRPAAPLALSPPSGLPRRTAVRAHHHLSDRRGKCVCGGLRVVGQKLEKIILALTHKKVDDVKVYIISTCSVCGY